MQILYKIRGKRWYPTMPKAKHSEHGQEKKIISMSVPEDAVKGLDEWAKELNISRSELVTRIGLGKIPLNLSLESQHLGESSAS
ncbi:ribbon-helix-helix protein, CopG family [Egbenema bharatensis]|uniref:ribbon-helix-helix protein, CopG family n=1 Tax=Egbenema bharatensis TaxID=3463334 RepID=UPI003A8A25AC